MHPKFSFAPGRSSRCFGGHTSGGAHIELANRETTLAGQAEIADGKHDDHAPERHSGSEQTGRCGGEYVVDPLLGGDRKALYVDVAA